MSLRTLGILIALELVGAALWIHHRSSQQAPTEKNFALLDEATATDLRELHQRLMRSVDAGQDNAKSWLAMADAYATYGYFREASRYYRRATQLDARNAKATFRWALCLDRLARFPEAIDRFEQTVSLTRDPRQRQACHYFVGKIHLKQEQPEKAIQAFRSGGKYIPCQYELANLLIRTGRVNDAEPLLKSLDRYATAIGVHLIRARAAEAQDDLDTAAAHYDAAERGDEITLHLTDRGYLKKFHALYGTARMSNEGYELARQGKQKEGLDILHTAFEQNQVVLMQPFYIRLEMAVNGPQAARHMIHNRIDRMGESPEFLELLGDTYWEESDDRQAETAWLESAKMQGSSSVHEKLAQLYQQRSEAEKVRYHQGEALYEKGVAAYRANDLKTAQQALVRAMQAIPQKANGWFYLGQTLRVQQNETQAREAYERCLAINPYHGRASQFLVSTDTIVEP